MPKEMSGHLGGSIAVGAARWGSLSGTCAICGFKESIGTRPMGDGGQGGTKGTRRKTRWGWLPVCDHGAGGCAERSLPPPSGFLPPGDPEKVGSRPGGVMSVKMWTNKDLVFKMGHSGPSREKQRPFCTNS